MRYRALDENVRLTSAATRDMRPKTTLNSDLALSDAEPLNMLLASSLVSTPELAGE